MEPHGYSFRDFQSISLSKVGKLLSGIAIILAGCESEGVFLLLNSF